VPALQEAFARKWERNFWTAKNVLFGFHQTEVEKRDFGNNPSRSDPRHHTISQFDIKWDEA